MPNRPSLIACAVGALMGLLLWSLYSGEPGVSSEPPSEVPHPAAAVPPPDPARERGQGPAREAAEGPAAPPLAQEVEPELAGVPAAGEPMLHIEGRVVRRTPAGLRSVPGARVRLLGDPFGHGPATGPLAQTTADGAGDFSLPVAHDLIRDSGARVEAQGAGLVAEETLLIGSAIWVDPKVGAADHLRDVLLLVAPAGVVSGTVVDADGEPMAGVRIVLERSKSGASYRPGPLAGTGYRRLDDGGWRDNAPVVTDGQGGFRIEGAQGDRWVLCCRHGSHVHTHEVGPVGDAPVAIQVVWPPVTGEPETDSLLFGQVLDPAGRGVAGAKVGSLGHETVATGPDGAFQLHWNRNPLLRDDELVAAWADGFAPTSLRVPVESQPEVGPVVFRLEPALALAGVLLDAEGKPVAKGFVRLEGSEAFQDGSPGPTTLRSRAGLDSWCATDVAGRFRFDAVRRQLYRLSYRGDAPGGRGEAVVMGGSEDVVLRCGSVQGPKAEWAVEVVDALTGQPLAGAHVSLWRMIQGPLGSASSSVASTGADRFGACLLAAGLLGQGERFQVFASHPGYLGGSSEPKAVQPGRHGVRIRLMPARTLQLLVVAANGEPLEGARVQVLGEAGQPVALNLGAGGAATMAQVGPDGRIHLSGLPAAAVTVQLLPEVPSNAVGQQADSKPLAELTIDLRADLPHSATLIGP